MRCLEIRRHSKREPSQLHLSQWGVDLARRTGEALGPFDKVVTSPLPRCVETAVAMGCAVNATYEELAGDDGLGETFPDMIKINWAEGYQGFARMIATSSALAEFAEKQAKLWRVIVQTVPEGGRVLLIVHGGGYLEGAAAVCLPHADHKDWGPTSSYCEGLRLFFKGNRWDGAEILRAS